MLPFQFQVLVAPGHVHMPRLQVSPVFAYLRDVQRETTAHRLGDGGSNLLLSLPWFGPKLLNHFAAMFNFHEGTARVISCAPNSKEFRPGFRRPIRPVHKIRNLDRELLRIGIDHDDGQKRFYLFSKSILAFQNSAVGANPQFCLERGLAFRVARPTFLKRDFTLLPRIRRGKIRAISLIGCPGVIILSAREPGALHLRRLVEFVDP